MLISRLFQPTADEIIYHYCSAETFHSICTNRTIRFCDLFAMNDFLEVHWGYSILGKAVGDIAPFVSENFIHELQNILYSDVLRTTLASCFSLQPDVLSQWRAYANDGRGYCIGFNAQMLTNLPVKGVKVLYNRDEQLKEMKATLKTLNSVENDLPIQERFGNDFKRTCYQISADLAAFKNPAFSEEMEVRLLHLLNIEPSNQFLKLSDPGGNDLASSNSSKEIKFKITRDLPTPYIDYKFSEDIGIHPIKEVYLGPKNVSLPTAVSIFLETIGLGNVTIRESKASYR